MSECQTFGVYVVEIRYLSMTVPTYLRHDWETSGKTLGQIEVGSLVGPRDKRSPAATFWTREAAESEALKVVAVYPRYLGCVTVAPLFRNGHMMTRGD